MLQTFDRSTVHVNRTGATLRGVADDVSSGQPQRIADEVHQQQARFHFGADGFSVDVHGKPDWHGFSLLGGEGRATTGESTILDNPGDGGNLCCDGGSEHSTRNVA
jgi:hypothetical protein